MRIRTRAGLAWGLLGLYVLLVAAAVALAALNDLWGQIGWIGSSVTFPLVGALIASRVSSAVGWICLAVAAL